MLHMPINLTRWCGCHGDAWEKCCQACQAIAKKATPPEAIKTPNIGTDGDSFIELGLPKPHPLFISQFNLIMTVNTQIKNFRSDIIVAYVICNQK
jgi:hypothetical protein